MWNSLNWVVISSEKELEVTTRRFDQYALIVIRRMPDSGRCCCCFLSRLLEDRSCEDWMLEDRAKTGCWRISALNRAGGKLLGLVSLECCCINEPVFFSNCVQRKLWHRFHALLKVCSDRDDIVPLKSINQVKSVLKISKGNINRCITRRHPLKIVIIF